ncbi:PPOX class F420-dependent oxidoreductase [Streptomyces sp. NPDC001985]|uniref:PPOX class F420-dependent oxidoreductase n=1 Tax=Streptomyces sp. NPDC001985 TaxID=3154406 RepID=UPI003319D00E
MTVEDFATAKYISLTTFRKNGTGVATPVWFAPDGGKLYIWTNTESWKVKRLRNDSRVIVTVCDVRGRIAPGAASAEGTAELLDDTSAVRRLMARKYRWQFRLVDLPSAVLRRGKRPHTAIAVTLAGPGSGSESGE